MSTKIVSALEFCTFSNILFCFRFQRTAVQDVNTIDTSSHSAIGQMAEEQIVHLKSITRKFSQELS
jgi:hypothetical protein